MNTTIEMFTRTQILDGLQKLPLPWQDLFRKMYGPKTIANGGVITDPAEDINDVVGDMSSDKLDWALSQVEASLKKRKDKQNLI